MIKIYNATEINFESNGLGILRDTLSCKITEQLNSQYDLQLEYPIKGWLAAEIREGNIIKAPAGHISGQDQLFRIKSVKRTLSRVIVVAPHIFYDLKDNYLEDVRPENKSGAAALEWILSHTKDPHNFTSYSDIATQATAFYIGKNPVESLLGVDNCFIKVWGGELLRDNFMVKILEARGQDRGVQIRHGKNLTEIEWDIDDSEVATRIYPQGYNGLIIPEKYIESPNINNYYAPKNKRVEFSDIKIDEGAGDTEEVAQQKLRDAVGKMYEAGIDKPRVNIKVNFVELSKTKEYKELYSAFESIYLGDTVKAVISSLGLTISLKIIKTVYDAIVQKYDSFEIGDYQPNYVEASINQQQATITDIMNNNINVLKSAQAFATGQITAAMGGYILKTQNELYILDQENITEAQRVWRWNLNGLGYSSTGVGGPYNLAITQDGTIVADFIKTGQLDGVLIKAGTIEVDQISVAARTALQSELFNEIVNIDNQGINVSNADSETSTRINSAEFAIYNYQTRVLTVNKDTTILKKTTVEEDFTVGHIKQIVRDNGLDVVYVD